MPPDASNPALAAAPASALLSLDFRRRAAPHELPEWMDEPGSYADLRACLRHLAQVNRVTLAYRPTLRFVRTVAAAAKPPVSLQHKGREPLRIVDVGSGGGDTLRVLERWGRQHEIPLELTGVDLNPHAARAARDFTPANSTIRWITADALSLPPAGIDLAISSLFTHHLEEPAIVQFLAWMERVSERGWFINDLRRSRGSFWLFRALANTVRWHPFVRHDGPVSIRRSFREEDWRRMLTQANIPPESCRIERRFPGRLCVSRFK